MKKVSSILLVLTLMVSVTMVAFGGEFNLSEVMEYKALPSYQQAPSLRQAVAAGKLPPVEQRLPKEPRVLKSTYMSDGLGVYGGVFRDFSAVPTEGWNWAAGQTQGWFGINQIIQESLVRTATMYLLKEPEPLPNLATSWEWSKDGKTLTMHLIEGAKWSDGVEFTADDVLFTYYDIILDPHVPSWVSADIWTMNGKVTELEKVDKYTIKWHFGAAFPIYIFYYMDYLDFSVAPKHVLAKYHPKYNPDATYDQFINCQPPEDLPVPVLGPWVPVKYEPDKLLVMRRNPYYWTVDEEGRQLPYMDETVFEKGRSGVTRTLNLIAGTCDHTNAENPGAFSFLAEQAQREDAPFRIIWETYTLNYQIYLNLALRKGVASDRDRALRDLFRDLRFRKALSYAIDREGIALATLPGPMVRPLPSGFPSGAAYYDANAVTSYNYDPEAAKSLLSELGFKDTEGDGILNWTTGPLAGQNLIITVNINEDQAQAVKIGEALVPMLRDVGIKLNMKVLKAPVMDAKVDSAEWEMLITRPDVLATPFAYLTELGPITSLSPDWHHAGRGGVRDLLPFEEKIKELLEEVKTETSASRRAEIFSEIQALWTKNLYTVGVIEARRGTGINKRIRNLPPNCPSRLHQWWWTNAMPEQLWVPEDEQLKEFMPDVIPEYKK